MRFFSFLLVAWAAGSSAAIVASCGSSCIARAIKKTGCAPSDSKCICASEHYSGYLNYCITKRCNASEKDAEIKSATAICNVVEATQPDEDDSDASFIIQKRDSSVKRNDRNRDHHGGSGSQRGSSWNQPVPAHDHQPAPQPPPPPPPPPAAPGRGPPGQPASPPGPGKNPPPGHPKPGPPPPLPSSTTWFTPTPTHTVLPWN